MKSVRKLQETLQDGFGSKARMLSQLSNQFTIPAGIALSTAFYEDFLEQNHFPFREMEFTGRNQEIQSFLRKSKFGLQQEEAIAYQLKSSHLLGNGKTLIVRSSAICEDSVERSMAGMFVSIPVSADQGSVYNAIKECYCSLFAEHVLEYVSVNHLNLSLLKMGIVIQENIKGIYSGVVFTADTKQHTTDSITINYVYGGCSGFVDSTAASYYRTMDKKTGKTIDRKIPDDSGSDLPIRLVNLLFETGLKIEQQLGFCADIEWTYDGGTLYILQARPITGLKYRRACFKLDDSDLQYHWFLAEPDALRPLFHNYCQIAFSASGEGILRTGYSARNMAMRSVNGYMYWSNVRLEYESILQEKGLQWFHEVSDQGMGIFEDYCLPKLLHIKKRMDQYMQSSDNDNGNLADFLELTLVYAEQALISHWESVLGETYIDDFHKYLQSIYGKIHIEQLHDLLYVKTIKTEERELLLEIADYVKSVPALVEIMGSSPYPTIVYERMKLADTWTEVDKLIQKYLVRFGMSYAGRFNYPAYTLWEMPQYVIEKVKKILLQDKEAYLTSLSGLQRKKAEIYRQIISILPEAAGTEFERKLAVAEKAFASIDNHHYYCEDIQWGYVKTAINACSQRLVLDGILKCQDDIYYLNFDEICKLLRKTVVSVNIEPRILTYREQCKVWAPPYLGLQNTDNGKADARSPSCRDILRGVSSMCRSVTGNILLGPFVPDEIEQAVILVVRDGHAGDLFPVIHKIKGLIVEGGSPFDHMGIITREMNIPALYYVKDALAILKTGDQVLLNGEEGTLTILQ